jgi:hypothetical protein
MGAKKIARGEKKRPTFLLHFTLCYKSFLIIFVKQVFFSYVCLTDFSNEIILGVCFIKCT